MQKSNLPFQLLLLVAGMPELPLAAVVCVLWVAEAPCIHKLSKHAATDMFWVFVAGKSAAGKTAAAAKGGKNSAKVLLPKCVS